MPAKKDEPKAEPKAKKASSDPQGHPAGGPDYVPTADEYDPDKHANHSHPNP